MHFKMSVYEHRGKLKVRPAFLMVVCVVIASCLLMNKQINDRSLLAEVLLELDNAQTEEDEKNTVLAGSRTLKVLTQNIWCHYLAKIGPNVESRLKTFIQGAQSYDIVLLQELFVHKMGFYDRTHLAKLAVKEFKLVGFKYHTSFYETAPNFYGQSSGVVIFSRLPITQTHHVAFKDVGEHFTNKGFVLAEIRHNKRMVQVCSLHLDAFEPRFREKNMHQIGKYLRKPVTQPVKSKDMHRSLGCEIIGGDFNIRPVYKKKYKNLAELKQEYPKLVKFLHPLVDIFPKDTITVAKSGHLPDHMFVDPIYKVRSKKVEKFMTTSGQPVSDHYGLGVELEF